MYGVDKGKGVRKKYIPPPCEVELPQSASLNDVLVAGRKKVFDDEEIPLSSLALADSSGSRIDIEDEESWNIGDFYSKLEYKPGRYKLYVMYIHSSCKSISSYAYYGHTNSHDILTI